MVLKDANDSKLRWLVSRSFQRVGAPFWNALSPQVTGLLAGTFNKFVSAERVLFVMCFYSANHLDIWVLFLYMLSKLEQVSENQS